MADVSQIRLPNGDTFDLIDEKSGYITAQYIENKTDYSIPVSRVGEIVVGKTAIGTDSTNFPTSKAVVDYVDERVVQEIDAIDVGVTEVKANGMSLAVENGVVNIPVIGPNQSAGLMTGVILDRIYNRINKVSNSIPTSTSQLTNDSGFITSETDPTVPAWAKAATKPTYTASEVGALPSDTVIPEDKIFIAVRGTTTYNDILAAINAGKVVFCKDNVRVSWRYVEYSSSANRIYFINFDSPGAKLLRKIKYLWVSLQNEWNEGTWIVPYKTSDLTNDSGFITASDIPTIPTKTSDLTNDSGYLTASDIASVMTYKGTKANYAALPSTGNTTGDVWHLTDTGAEWAWDGSAWQELGTAIDLSNYATKATTLAGYGITDAKIENGTITLGSNTITPLTSYTETDPIFSASAASGIGSSDITNWNGKVNKSGDTMTGNLTMGDNEILFIHDSRTIGIKGTHYYQSNYDTTHYGISFRVGSNSAILLRNIKSPITNTDAANKAYVDNAVSRISIPTKTSDLTNDSGFITTDSDEKVKQIPLESSDTARHGFILSTNYGNTEQTSTVNSTNYLGYKQSSSELLIYASNGSKAGAWSYDKLRFGNLGSYSGTIICPTLNTAGRTYTLPDATGTIALTSDIPTVPTKVSDLTNDSGFISSYTETDPIFSASAAAGITATDISNWNAKVSDDKTWNGVTLDKRSLSGYSGYIPYLQSTTSTTASLREMSDTPSSGCIAVYNSSSYLTSKTPSANDNSTKVATTAYVDSTVPKIHIIDLAYDDTIDGKSIYNSGDFTCKMVKDYIDNNELVILKMYQQFYYFDTYDRGVSDLTFVAQNFGEIGKDVLTPYKESGGAYSNKWCAFASDLPIYDGTVE